MNWYKKSQIITDLSTSVVDDDGDENQKKAEIYFGLGHGDFIEETGLQPDFQLWILLDGEILKSKVFKVNQELGYVEDEKSHSILWGYNEKNINYKGRYELQTGRLSVVKPSNQRFRDVPTGVLNKIKSAFPQSNEILIF